MRVSAHFLVQLDFYPPQVLLLVEVRSSLSMTVIACTDTNCALCDNNLSDQHCFRCQNDFYLDLSDYKCKASCDSVTHHVIESTNVHGFKETAIRYCRPYKSDNVVEFYVDSSSPDYVELGTIDYPFKVIDAAQKEILNFYYEKLNVNVYHMRGTNYRIYYGIMPLVFVGVGNYTLTDYGDPA